jgi:soluble lytic murein transglycosylase
MSPRKALLAASGLALVAGAALGWWSGGRAHLGAFAAPLEAAAREAGVDPALLGAMVAVESGGRPRASSHRGARGLLQLLPSTAAQEARSLGLDPPDEEALYDPATNLRLGASYLARLLARYDGVEVFALAAYNAGPSHLDRWRRRAPEAAPLEVVEREGFDETRRYVLAVLDRRRRYAGE